jgi:hypothetical protein
MAYWYGFIIFTIPGLLNYLTNGPRVMLMANSIHHTEADHKLTAQALIARLKIQI